MSDLTALSPMTKPIEIGSVWSRKDFPHLRQYLYISKSPYQVMVGDKVIIETTVCDLGTLKIIYFTTPRGISLSLNELNFRRFFEPVVEP